MTCFRNIECVLKHVFLVGGSGKEKSLSTVKKKDSVLNSMLMYLASRNPLFFSSFFKHCL